MRGTILCVCEVMRQAPSLLRQIDSTLTARPDIFPFRGEDLRDAARTHALYAYYRDTLLLSLTERRRLELIIHLRDNHPLLARSETAKQCPRLKMRERIHESA